MVAARRRAPALLTGYCSGMRNVLFVVLVAAACGGKTAAPEPAGNHAPPVEQQGSATAEEPTGAVCGTRGAAQCPANMFCSYQPGASCGEADAPGHCAVKPDVCAEIYQPVCGCDGKTYGNSCAAAAAAVGVRADGPC